LYLILNSFLALGYMFYVKFFCQKYTVIVHLIVLISVFCLHICIHTYIHTHTQFCRFFVYPSALNIAEQLAILRALEYTENLQTEDKTATIYTDSRMTLDSLKNSKIHTFLIEEMRRKLTEMGKINWKI